jgi:hypothetical protein
MRCSNCDTPIPRGATVCPNCGVYALDAPPKAPLPPGLAALVDDARREGAVSFFVGSGKWPQSDEEPMVTRGKPLPVHVVRDRPGGNVSEAEAIRMLRSYFAERGIPADCVAILSNGLRAGAYHLTALDRCKNIKLGPWTVDAKTHEVKMR